MGLVPIFTGHVDADARLILADVERDLRRRHLESLRGRQVEIVVRKRRTQRSLDQNKYLHAVPFALLGDYWGEDLETTKLLVLGECFGWKDAGAFRLPIKARTSLLTVEETMHLIDWIPPWAMTHFGVDVPLPEKAEAA